MTRKTLDIRAANGRQNVQSLERSLDILETLSEFDQGTGLSDLASRTGLPSPTIHRLLQTLVARGYVRRTHRKYTLGPRLVGLADASHRMLRLWAEPFLRQLAEETAETANLAVMEGDYAFNVAQALPHHGLRMFTEIGRQIMLHRTAAGKVMIAQMTAPEVDQLVARVGIPPATPQTITDLPALHAQLETIRAMGFAIDDGEQELGVRCAAVPVHGLPQRAAITVAGPDSRLSHARATELVPRLEAVARDFTEWWRD